MCGIAGFVGSGGLATLQAMMDRLVHRGPDGEGAYEEPESQVLLGHRRLAVIDLDYGAQPMWDADRQIGIVYNGEIYNHASLRQELEAHGHRFQTDHCDTEVLIHGYRQWGRSMLERLNGMFAFCLFDRPGRKLLLARDRMGEKPLYYYSAGGLFAFASEPYALFAHPEIDFELDGQGVQKFFAYGYSPGRSTVFKNVQKLLAGESLVYDLAQGEQSRQRYFTFRLKPDSALARRSEDELAEEMREHLNRAVALRLEADVPLGLFLSGGIDSSAILASACWQRPPQSVEAFTIGFEEKSYDESPYAITAARHFDCRHHLRKLTLDETRNSLSRVFSDLGEPFGDPSILPTSMLSAFAREKVTVALSGDGGDELFAGYDPFAALKPANVYHKLVPGQVHRLMRGLAGYLPVADSNMSIDYKIRRTLMGLSYAKPYWLPAWMSAIEPDEMHEFFSDPLPTEELYSEAREVWDDNLTGNDIDRTLEYFTRIYLPDDILLKTDRAAMMHSLEARAVFLDNDLVDFAARLPREFKIRGGERKWLLKRALAGILPRQLLERPKKGFGIPISAWLRELEPPSGGVEFPINAERILESWQSHRERRSDHRLLLWNWLSFQESLSKYGAKA